MNSSAIELYVPDDAIKYIVSKYLTKKSVESVSVTVGIPSATVEDVVFLFLQWANAEGYIEDGKLSMSVEDE